jgi:transcriptional regulator with XRE-family HTH domain
MSSLSRRNQERRKDIRRRCLDIDITYSQIAEKLGVSRSLVTHVVAGRRAHSAVRAEIAALCGVSIEQLWES